MKDDLPVDTGPQFEWVDQHGHKFSSNDLSGADGHVAGSHERAGGTLPLLPLFGGSGPKLRAF